MFLLVLATVIIIVCEVKTVLEIEVGRRQTPYFQNGSDDTVSESITNELNKTDDLPNKTNGFSRVPTVNTVVMRSDRKTTPRISVIHCNCSIRKSRGGATTVQKLDSVISWLNETTKEHLTKHHPNLPIDFLYKISGERSCNLLPTLFHIEWRNKHWQETKIFNTTIHLYSAFYDPNPDGEPCVRLLGVTKSTKPHSGWCQLWFTSKDPPVVSKVTTSEFVDWQNKDSSRQMPYLFTCLLPSEVRHLQPAAVSLVQKPCQIATNLLKAVGGKERESSAYQHGQIPDDPGRSVKGWVPAVCGPALYYYHNDFSKRLVEWVEILRAEGFGRVFLYTTDVHPNVQKVLDYYVKDGFIQVTDYQYPPPYVNEPSIRRLWTLVQWKQMFAQENVYFTDCLLRHMHQYRFIAHFDPDEVPILPKYNNFTHLLDVLLTKERHTTSKKKQRMPPAYKFQWNFFHDDLQPQGESAKLPEYLWSLRHTRRLVQDLKVFPGKYKSLFDMNTVRGIFSHDVLLCTTWKCRGRSSIISPSYAYIGHFKLNCGQKCRDANATREELFLHKFKKPVIKAVTDVLKRLQLIV
ncbi:uncharacterized protein LOC121871232 [Homarus americanus]|uniref:uncharacterized protein LOC121871232 n=1 Tax=Homarus americanus TaxID=6706 RepID=UPI001C491921|nr:uncharacterized protein LOC121871232 [Homarus americanus]